MPSNSIGGIAATAIFFRIDTSQSFASRTLIYWSWYVTFIKIPCVLCYWAARELGISTLALSKRLGISQPTASQSVKRGEKIVKEKQLKVTG